MPYGIDCMRHPSNGHGKPKTEGDKQYENHRHEMGETTNPRSDDCCLGNFMFNQHGIIRPWNRLTMQLPFGVQDRRDMTFMENLLFCHIWMVGMKVID